MKVFELADFWGGWFCGNFEPSVLKTDAFEIAYKTHPAGETWPTHYHRIATEINVVIKGCIRVQGQNFTAGQIFVMEPLDIADPEFIEDTDMIVIKTPSVSDDKILVM